jgi:hypothetical protein
MNPAALIAQSGPCAATAIVAFVSALVGVPPFFLVSILAGALGMNFWLFFLTGLGRCLRLILIVESPHAIMGLFR